MRLLQLLMLGFLLPAAAAAQAPREVPRSSLAQGEHQIVVNDVRLWYRVAGRPTGTPLVYLHGGPGQGSQSFAHFVGPYFERTNRVVYLDQPAPAAPSGPGTRPIRSS